MKMKQSKKLIRLIVITTFLNWLFTYQALAYVDPGTGSYIFQMALASILGASFVLKTYWQKICAFFIRLFNKPTNDND